ncbi:N-terminal double-transmembrane domain-containing protein [Hymenobacter gelipurpurascens]|uniref:N-terminal double-transmembrane domain-containing protein n=1 Tax=Hymenobacter gelipurpurascens TaxID=89968 RepID=A0A212UGH4_9BACT|nr:BatA domain-containing protein [Hymenobacter gelipurpurascens]SNC77270.1 N-terminal double-transmembrane domain-containing protein [Hymenobacter gelipurpurascens]
MPAFYFQHPTAGLLALLGLAVPVAIYLWNRKPGRVVQVGSLRWLEAAANRRLRSLKPEGLLLLLVRVAILSLLAVALAGPSWLGQVPPRRGQILLSSEASAEALRSLRPTLDSLLRRGYELRELKAGLPLVAPDSQNTWLTGQRSEPATFSGASIGQAADNRWTQLQQAADSFPHRPLVVVAPLSLRRFQGTRPMLPAAVRWLPTPATPDSVVQLVAAWQPRPDSLLLLMAYSTETGVSFRRVRLGHPAPGAVLRVLPAPDKVRYQVVAGKAELEVKTATSTTTIPVQTAQSRLWISYDAEHTADARVLSAALKAAGSVAPVPPQVTATTALPAEADSLTGLFWLRSAPVPAGWQRRVRRGLRVWQEAAGPGTPAATSVSFSASAPVRILRHDTLGVLPAGWVLWRDAQGGPLLSVQQQGQGRLYQLHTRLTQPWSELADSPELPAQLLPYLWPTVELESGVADLRVLDPGQVVVQRPGSSSTPDSVGTKKTSVLASSSDRGLVRDYTPWLVLAAGALFGLERWLAARRSAHSLPVSA